MAQYNHLPIYNKAYFILREMHGRVPKFHKQYKYTLGSNMIMLCMDVVRNIILANSEWDQPKKKELISEIVINTEMLLTDLRIAEDLKQLSNKKSYEFLLGNIIEISKQAEGWKKSIK